MRIDDGVRGRRLERADCNDAITIDPHAAGLRGCAGPVDDDGVRDQDRRMRVRGPKRQAGKPGEPARSQRTDEVGLAERDAVVAQDVVGRGKVKIEVRQREHEQEVEAREVDGMAAELPRDRAVLGAVDLRGLERLDGRRCTLDACDQVRERRLDVVPWAARCPRRARVPRAKSVTT